MSDYTKGYRAAMDEIRDYAMERIDAGDETAREVFVSMFETLGERHSREAEELQAHFGERILRRELER